MRFYNDWAGRILAGQWTDHHAFYGLPLYPYLLAGLYKLFGYNFFVPAFLQVLADAGTAWLLYQIALLVFRRNEGRMPGTIVIGTLAALGWIFFLPSQGYGLVLMPTALFVFAFWFVVWQIVRRNERPRPLWFFFIGAFIGFVAMGIASILFLIPLVLLAAWIRWPSSSGKQSRTSALVFAGLFLGMAPCWIHNYFIAHDPVLLSAHGGVNFWIGNNPDATGYPHFPPGLRASQQTMLQDSIATAEKAAGRPLSHSEVSAFWSAKARSYILEQPRDWLRLLLAKIRNFWSAFRYDDLSVITIFRDEGILMPGLGFGLAAALGLPGLIFAFRGWPLSRWVSAAIFLQMFSLLPVFITERYRLAAAPGLLLGAAWMSVEFWNRLIARRYYHSAAFGSCVIAVAWLVSWPFRDPSLWALADYNSGWSALANNKLPLAERRLLRAYAYVPGNSEINFALGNLRLAQKNPTEAVSFYLAALQLKPEHAGAFNNLGLIALEERHFEQAAELFSRAIRQEPGDAKAHYLLATAYLRLGKRAEARSEISVAMRLDPNQPAYAKLRDEIL